MKLIKLLSENEDTKYPMIGKLKRIQQSALEDIKSPANLKSVELLAEWTDDRAPCVGVKVNGIIFSLWWLHYEYAAAFMYTDSKKAQKAIVAVIKDQIGDVKEDGEWKV